MWIALTIGGMLTGTILMLRYKLKKAKFAIDRERQLRDSRDADLKEQKAAHEKLYMQYREVLCHASDMVHYIGQEIAEGFPGLKGLPEYGVSIDRTGRQLEHLGTVLRMLNGNHAYHCDELPRGLDRDEFTEFPELKEYCKGKDVNELLHTAVFLMNGNPVKGLSEAAKQETS